MKKPLNLRIALLAGTALLLLILQAAALVPNVTTPLELVEYSARDAFMRLRGEQEISSDIVIVAIDDFSFNWTGLQWPWPRSYFAEIVEQINAGGGKVIGVDIILSEPDKDPANDEAFAKALGESPASSAVMQIDYVGTDEFKSANISLPQPVYLQVLDNVGITAVNSDEDAIVRRIVAYNKLESRTYLNWAFEVARLYLDVNAPTNITSTSMQFNGQTIPLNQGNLLINYAGSARTYPTFSASDVHDGITLEENPDAFRGKIVLIGATSFSMQDVYPTPFSPKNRTPGVEIVANSIDTIINGKYITLATSWINYLTVILAAFLAYLITLSKRPSLTVTLLIASMVGYLIAAFVMFVSQRYVLPVVAPQVMLFLGVVLPTLEQAVSQEMEKRRVRNLFSRFISPEMVDQMISTQDLASLNKRADLSILFSDIRGFTTLSEKLSPEEVVALLNPYLEAMSKVIYKHGGTVDKYEGDAIIAFFGEPVPYKDHAARSIRASLDMRIALAELKEEWAKEGRDITFEMGIGINSGEVFVGLLGSEQRINYTVIGDNANLAARLQDLTKTYAWPILVSESTYEQVSDEFDAELADAVTVKGKTRPVNVYKIIGRKGAQESEKLQGWQL